MLKHLTLNKPLTITDITQRTVMIIGGKKTGKTQTLKMCGYCAPLEVPVYIFDPLNVIYIEGFARIIVNKTSVKRGAAFGKVLGKLQDKKIVIAFNGMLQSEIAEFMNDLFANWQPHHALILIDEVHEITPENTMGAVYAHEVERAVRHWRNNDVGFILTTQRPAFCSKKVLGLMDFAIIYRVTWTADRETVKKLLQEILKPDQLINVMQRIQTNPFLTGYSVDFIGNEVKNP